MKFFGFALCCLSFFPVFMLFALETAESNKPPAACQPCEKCLAADGKNEFKGVHLGVLGGFGLSNANATFSTFPAGTGVDYRTATEAAMMLAYYWAESRGVTVGFGNTIRNLAFKDSSGSGNYPMNFIDIRAGYRVQAGLFLAEAGLLYGIKTQDVPITINAGGSTVSGILPGVSQNNFVALYLMLGMYFPFSSHIFGLFAAKMDYGLTPAISGNVPVSATATQTISLIPFSVEFNAGIGLRL